MDLIENGQLVRKISGTIMNNLGQIRGVTALAPSELTHYKNATRVYYWKTKSFVFYGEDLPLDIEGSRFKFEEKYIGNNADRVPVMQRLVVFFKKGKQKKFEF